MHHRSAFVTRLGATICSTFCASLCATLCATFVSGVAARPIAFQGAVPVDDAKLADVRGGFTSPVTGLEVSFGIERAVYVNGDRAVSTLVQSTGPSGFTLVQRGAGNSVDPAMLGSVASGTVIQNSLDNQKIQTVTTIDIKANSLQNWNGMNLRSSVSNAVTASLRR